MQVTRAVSNRVTQLLLQFLPAFEFNTTFLLVVMERLTSGRFANTPCFDIYVKSHKYFLRNKVMVGLCCSYGTFMFSCERERREKNATTQTNSAWTEVAAFSHVQF